MSTKPRYRCAQCPSCKDWFNRSAFDHACKRGPWFSAAICSGCNRKIDGNRIHFCPAAARYRYQAMIKAIQ